PDLGKSVLSSVIIDELENSVNRNQKVLPLYFFCRGTDDRKRSSLSVIRALAYQYVEAIPAALSYVYGEVMKRNTSQLSLANIFETILKIGDPDIPVSVIVDGLDELPPD